MLNCDWAFALTRYDCQTLKALDGGPCLEIGTPCSLPDGSAINIYISTTAQGLLKIGDNGDSLFQLNGMGLDIWRPTRLGSLRDFMAKQRMQLSPKGDVHLFTSQVDAANGFAIAVTGLLALASWAGIQLQDEEPPIDLVAELEPYIIARNPSAPHKRNPQVRGASNTEHTFDLQHGNDLIDVITANANATGSAMRKAGDVLNGPFAGHLSPLIIVDDRRDSAKAMSEIGILGSVTRAMPASRLMQALH